MRTDQRVHRAETHSTDCAVSGLLAANEPAHSQPIHNPAHGFRRLNLTELLRQLPGDTLIGRHPRPRAEDQGQHIDL
jgi:hypothetical protein